MIQYCFISINAIENDKKVIIIKKIEPEPKMLNQQKIFHQQGRFFVSKVVYYTTIEIIRGLQLLLYEKTLYTYINICRKYYYLAYG